MHLAFEGIPIPDLHIRGYTAIHVDEIATFGDSDNFDSGTP